MKRAVLVTASLADAWEPSAKQRFEEMKGILSAKGIAVELKEGGEVLNFLLNTGVLGFSVIQNRVYPLGPEEYGVRYDRSKKEFVYGVAPGLDLQRYRTLPQSFIPSLFWGTYYQDKQREWAKEEMETEDTFPMKFWDQYAFKYEGIRFVNSSQLRALFRHTRRIKNYSYDDFENDLLVGFSWSRKHDYPGGYAFDCSDYVELGRVKELMGKIQRAAFSWRQKRGSSDRMRFQIVSSCSEWSPEAWAEAGHGYRDYIDMDIPIRGDKCLWELLNAGLLGFAFSKENKIVLVGPERPAVFRRATLGG